MRPALLRFIVIIFYLISCTATLTAQNCFKTGLNGTVINLTCGQNCINVPFSIPHLKSSSDYIVTTAAYNPYPYVTAGGSEDPNIYNDDRYSTLFDIPFSFCFFDSLFTKVSVGSNGVITFDYGLQNCNVATLGAAWNIANPLPYNSGLGSCDQTPTNYPKAAIMGVFQDLDPRPGPSNAINSSPPDRKIEWRVEGSAPCRRLVISYYKIGVYQQTNCGLNTPATFQIVLYESTGIIEIFIENKICTATSQNGNRAILGIQNWNRDKWATAPGKNATIWTASNEGYRFVPSGGASRFVSSVVQTLNGGVIATGDTTTTTPGMLDITFPNFCPAGATGQYVIKTIFSACDNQANQLVSYDTITVNKNSLNATQTTTQTSCGVTGTGTATITIPDIGTRPYTFVLNPGGTTITGNILQHQFTGLTAGNDTVIVTDAGGCSSIVPFTITSTGILAVNFNVTNTSCFGNTVANGGINVTPPNGTAPFTYIVNHPTAPIFTATQVGNGNFNNLAAGNYLLSVQDNAGCQALNLPFIVQPGPDITMDWVTTPTSCPGANNGTITITNVTGTAPYQYFINALPNPGNIFTNLAPGPYYISVIDAIGCQINFRRIDIVDGTSGVTGTAAPTPTTCAGVNDGKITVTPTSGSGPYQYSINNGATWQTGNLFTGLAPGSYNILIKEGVCTSGSIPATVTAGNGLQATLIPSSTTCNGASNGSISITMNSGFPPYTFVLDGTITQTSTTNATSFNNVLAGLHTVTATDVNGCITSSPIATTVSAGAGFTATFAPTPTGCAGVNNGKLVITAQNPGVAPFTVSLNPGSITQISPASIITYNNLAANTYNAIVTDANGCQFILNNMNVPAGAGLIASAANTSTTCNGVNNGTITITMGSGAPPFTAVMDGAITQTSNTNNLLFANVSAASHSITVTDMNGCITSSPVTTTVTAGTGFTASYTSSPARCAGASDGSLTITPQSPGTAPFTVSLNPGAIFQTSSASAITFNNLAANNYNAIITDANGCKFTMDNLTVASGNPLNATPTAVSTTCNGASNGLINITPASNGTTPYLYSLNNGTPQASPAFGGLASGMYTINVTDAGGCSSGSLSISIGAGPSINVTPDKVDAACFSSLTGSITVAPSTNATAPVQYSLDNATWQVSPGFPGLAAGTYTVYIRDAVGCSNSADITVGQPSQLLASTSQQSVLCNSGSSGKIIIAATGGTTPYSYSLDNINFQAGNTFNVAAGNYIVYVKDANGCVIPPITNVGVTEPALLTAASATTNATCDGGNNGIITINPAGGVSPYQFAITGGTYQTTNNFNVDPGTYDVTVQDVNGCKYPVTGIVVGLTNNLTYIPMIDPAPICEGYTVLLQLTTNATQFIWNNAASLSSSTIVNPIAKPSIPTLYTITATLGRCTITDDVFVPVIAAPIPDAGPPGDICYGKTYQLQGSGGVTFSWTPSTNLSSTTVSNPVVTPDKTITYTLNVTDVNGCPSLVPGQVTVKVTPPIKVTTYPADTVVYAGVQIPLLATSAGTDYVWSSTSGIAGLNNPNISDPVATAPFIDGTIIKYDVKATTSAGCDGWGYVIIKVYKGPDIYVPTAFSPNGDGKNELFIPFPVGIKQLNYFRVFNRWGQMLYSSTGLNKGWDGRFGGMEQAAGVYVWMAQGVTMDNKVIAKQGTVTLVR